MNNQLATTGQALSVTDITTISDTFYKSGMFKDCQSAAQAMVKIMAGAEMNIPPFQSMSGIHIIQGKPTIGAGLMAAKVKGSGKYNYRVLEQTEKVCSVDFYEGTEKLGNSTFTAEMAAKAGTQNMGKFPANMLFARAISNGVKFYTPDVFTGPVYVPEEMGAIQTEDGGYAEEVKEQPIVKAKKELLPGSAEWTKTIKALQEEKTTIEKVKELRDISPENETLLNQALEEAA